MLQSDLGLTYGGTLLANAGNTSTTVLTLTGSLATTPVPLWAVATNTLAIGAGAAFNIYVDGLGVTPLMSGVVPAAGAPIPLNGAASGLSLTWSVGTSVITDGWKATCAGLADQTANGKDAIQVGVTRQPVITRGLNGKPGLQFDGVNDVLTSTVGTLLAGIHLALIVGRVTALASGANSIIGGDGFFGTIYQNTPTTFTEYNNVAANAVTFSALTNQRWAGVYHNGASDSLRIGSTPIVTGGSAGAGNGNNRHIGATGTVPGQFGFLEVFAVIYCPVQDYSAFDAAINSAAGYGPGSVAV